MLFYVQFKFRETDHTLSKRLKNERIKSLLYYIFQIKYFMKKVFGIFPKFIWINGNYTTSVVKNTQSKITFTK